MSQMGQMSKMTETNDLTRVSEVRVADRSALVATTAEAHAPVEPDGFAAACRLFLHERYDEAIACSRGLIADARAAVHGAQLPAVADRGDLSQSRPQTVALVAEGYDGSDDHPDFWITTLVTSEPRGGRIAGLRPHPVAWLPSLCRIPSGA